MSICLYFTGFLFNEKLKYLLSDGQLSNRHMRVTGPRRWPLWTGAPCHNRCGTLKKPSLHNGHECRTKVKFATRHRQWWRLHWLGEKSQTNNLMVLYIKRPRLVRERIGREIPDRNLLWPGISIYMLVSEHRDFNSSCRVFLKELSIHALKN